VYELLFNGLILNSILGTLMTRWWVPIAISGFTINGLFMVYLVQRSSNVPIVVDIDKPQIEPLYSSYPDVQSEVASKNATTDTSADRDESSTQPVLSQSSFTRSWLRSRHNLTAYASSTPSALSLSSGYSAAHAAAIAVASAVAKAPLSKPEPIESINDIHKEPFPAKRKRLVFIHIESSATSPGSFRRSLIRETWLKFADPRWVDYRFFLSLPQSKALPHALRKAMESVRHEKRASVIKLGYSDIVLRGNNSVTGRGLAWEQWSILWADLELALCSRFKYYLRVSDDSMLCIPQLLAELLFRPELRTGPIFWGKFWCSSSVSVRPEEHFMLFSTDIIRFLVFDWTSEAPLIPFHSERTLSQNFGFFAMFLNVSLFDDRTRLSVAQDNSETAPKTPSAVPRRLLETAVVDNSTNNSDAVLINYYEGFIKQDGDVTHSISSDNKLLANTSDTMEVHHSPNYPLEFRSARQEAYSSSHRRICDRFIFIFKPGDKTAIKMMADGLLDCLKGLNWSDAITYDEDSHVQTKSMNGQNGLVSINMWQLDTLYRQYESMRREDADNAPKNAEVLQAPCADLGLANSDSSVLVSQFGARHRRSIEASLESLTSVKPQIPLISAGFRSNQNSNPYRNPPPPLHPPPPLRQNFLFGNHVRLRNNRTKPVTALHDTGRRPDEQDMPPLQQKRSGVFSLPQLGEQLPVQNLRLHDENNNPLKSSMSPERYVKTSSKAISSTQTAVQRFRSSLGNLQDLTPAGRRIKVNAAVDRTLKNLGLGHVKGSPEELLELAAVAAEKARSSKTFFS